MPGTEGFSMTRILLALVLLHWGSAVGMADTPEANKQLVREFTEVLNAADWDGLDAVLTEDFRRHSQATTEMPEITSREAFKNLQRRFLVSMPDQRVAIERLVAEGDWVAAYATYSGTNTGPMGDIPATGKAVELPFLSLFRIEEGKIAELWVEWDNVAFLGQLGLFPPPNVPPVSGAPSAEKPGAEIPRAEIDAVLGSLVAEQTVPGIVAVVADRQGIIGTGAVGVERVGATEAIEPESRLHVGSVSKPLTSSLMGVLVERGDLAWESRALDVLPELRATARPDYSDVTLAQLLSHTAGIPPFEEDEEFEAAPEHEGTARERRLEFARWLLTLDPVAAPGTAHVYSNAGYAIAAAMAERAADAPLEELMQRLVFDPLGLASAGAGPPAATWPGEPVGHTRDDDQWVARDPDEVVPFADLIRPAGDFHMSLLDRARPRPPAGPRR